jgi:hypothetical protein
MKEMRREAAGHRHCTQLYKNHGQNLSRALSADNNTADNNTCWETRLDEQAGTPQMKPMAKLIKQSRCTCSLWHTQGGVPAISSTLPGFCQSVGSPTVCHRNDTQGDTHMCVKCHSKTQWLSLRDICTYTHTNI